MEVSLVYYGHIQLMYKLGLEIKFLNLIHLEYPKFHVWPQRLSNSSKSAEYLNQLDQSYSQLIFLS
jgi:hypothetical protein